MESATKGPRKFSPGMRIVAGARLAERIGDGIPGKEKYPRNDNDDDGDVNDSESIEHPSGCAEGREGKRQRRPLDALAAGLVGITHDLFRTQ